MTITSKFSFLFTKPCPSSRDASRHEMVLFTLSDEAIELRQTISTCKHKLDRVLNAIVRVTERYKYLDSYCNTANAFLDSNASPEQKTHAKVRLTRAEAERARITRFVFHTTNQHGENPLRAKLRKYSEKLAETQELLDQCHSGSYSSHQLPALA